jgi:hypothetical protein
MMVRWKAGDTERRPRGAAVLQPLLRTRLRRPLAARVMAMPLQSRLRRAILRYVLRDGFQQFNEGVIWPSVAFHAEHAEVVTPLLGIEMPGRGRGPAAVEAMWSQWAEVWRGMRRDLVEERGDRLLLLCVQTGRGRDGLELREEVSLLFTWRGGEIVAHQEFLGHEAGRRPLSP